MQARVSLDTQFNVGPIDPRIFGGFLEHIGRAIYEGIYDPASPHADKRGFRRDVIEALRPMRIPLVRYPGGNFVSNYEWTDGIGPREQRPVRADYAWRTIEPNTFGTDEFCDWCAAAGTTPMMVINLGTGGPREAAAWLEYCNFESGTAWSDRRIANGHRKPHGVKLWGLGNELDGPWQAGQVPPAEYARRAQQAGKLMKFLDPSIELVAAGSTSNFLPTYMEWDREVLDYCWDDIDYLACHYYTHNRERDSRSLLAEGVVVDRLLEDYRHVIGYVRGKKHSAKNIYVSFDEWNVWHQDTPPAKGWQRAPHLLEEIYTFEAALVCGQYLASFIRNADLVKIACLAQLVNVIAPILTRPDGLVKQTIYHPFVMIAQSVRGRSLVPKIDGPMCDAGKRGEVPALDVAVSYDAERDEACVILTSRDLKRTLNVTLSLSDRRVSKVLGVEVLTGSDLKATNSFEHPDRVKPKAGKATIAEGSLRVRLPAPSLTVARVKLAKR